MVCLVIPALNEAEVIGESHSLGSAYRRESDHSRCTDATAQAAKNAGAMLVSPSLR